MFRLHGLFVDYFVMNAKYVLLRVFFRWISSLSQIVTLKFEEPKINSRAEFKIILSARDLQINKRRSNAAIFLVDGRYEMLLK